MSEIKLPADDQQPALLTECPFACQRSGDEALFHFLHILSHHLNTRNTWISVLRSFHIPLHYSAKRVTYAKPPAANASMSKRSGVPNGVEKTAKEVAQQPCESTIGMKSMTRLLLTSNSSGQAGPPPSSPKPRPLQLGPRLPPCRLHYPHERFLRCHVRPVFDALLPWPSPRDQPPMDSFGAHAVWPTLRFL